VGDALAEADDGDAFGGHGFPCACVWTIH